MRDSLVLLVRTILYEGVTSLCDLLRHLCRLCRPPKTGDHRSPSGCVKIDHPAFVRPDPLLYSQRHLIAQGLAVTWDNPDIKLFKAGVQVSSSELEPSTAYEVQARIWNNSLEAPVVNMPVSLSFLDFGIGTEPIPVGSVNVDVGVKGSIDQPAFASLQWTTPPTPGHYCLQVLLQPFDDLEPANNLGQENTDVVAVQSPAEFNFTLRNNTQRPMRYRFEIDAYQIPALPDCANAVPGTSVGLRNHRRGQHPVPAGFDVQIDPQSPSLNAGESVVVSVKVDPPSGFIGRQPINVNAFHEQGLAGGVTLTCTKEV
jgi:hypothetical protein